MSANKLRLMTPVYSVTLLLSAVLLFSVQPMFTKMILPLLGGAPQVWNTAMLFFQACLLGGYAYAHLTSKYLSIRTQGILHIVLLAICTVVLPFAIPEGWDPPADKDPTLWQLSLMALTVGGPFFIISGSAPMLQHWFGSSDHKDAQSPYFLYGASNLGSMTALLTYPVLTEPMLDLTGQTHLWMYGYITLILLTAASLFLLKPAAAGLKNANISKVDDAPISNALRLRWVILAAIPSSLMLGVTTYITTDIASVPLLWVLPLALYVSTFIFVFANKPWIKVDTIFAIFGTGLVSMAAAILFFKLWHNAILLIACHMVLFFLVALYCHFHLAKVRPGASKLTEFYFFMSLGGVIGGFFNAIIAPQFFVIAIEYHVMLVCAAMINLSWAELREAFSQFTSILKKPLFGGAFALLIVAVVLNAILNPAKNVQGTAAPKSGNETIFIDRNFFGVIRIQETPLVRTLTHGTTKHGSQARDESYRLTPLSYFSALSPLADAFKLMDLYGPTTQNVGVIGLGVGVVSCYRKEGRHFDFFEIDKDIADIASDPKYFTYLTDCGSPTIILGDGRLKLKKEKDDKYYDFFLLDAFSSDNIPVHLLTKEAVSLYLQKLKDDGILILHISNNYLDLEPVIAKITEELGVPAYSKFGLKGPIGDSGIEAYAAKYILISKNEKITGALLENGWKKAETKQYVKAWTDQYSNIFSVLKTKVTHER